MPDSRLRDALARCASGSLPANVALMQMAIAAGSKAEINTVLEAARAEAADSDAAARLERALTLWRETPHAFDHVKTAISDIAHEARVSADDWGAAFDRIAVTSPIAGMALYALGRDDLLAQATEEIADRLRGWQVLRPGAAVLDIGCGGGRLLRALAPTVGTAVGVEVSAGMLAAARRLCCGLANVELQRCSGSDLSLFHDGRFDLVIAVDVFPYLCLSDGDLPAKLMRESARVLKPGGALAIFNFSYSGDVAADRRELARLAAAASLEIVRNGTRDLELWDGLTFHLRKPA